MVKKNILSYSRDDSLIKILATDGTEYFAEKVFDSRSPEAPPQVLLQNFLGLKVTTRGNDFDPDKAVLMHFGKDQDQVLHFIYLLPLQANEALVESTVFHKSGFDEEWHKEKIYKYLEKCGIEIETEFVQEKGVIPMFNPNNTISTEKNVTNIGMRGGACRPSTGYAFSFLVNHIEKIKSYGRAKNKIHNFLDILMDSIFLNYLKNNNNTHKAFLSLASNLKGQEFQSFMMGNANLLTRWKIVKSLPFLPFIKALFQR